LPIKGQLEEKKISQTSNILAKNNQEKPNQGMQADALKRAAELRR
jgi:hypothetical protein